jgi:hypothetical protein
MIRINNRPPSKKQVNQLVFGWLAHVMVPNLEWRFKFIEPA